MSPVDETYADVHALLLKCCHKFRRMNEWFSIEELMEQADWAFCIAYHSYSPDKGKFSNWIWKKVVFELKEYRRNWYKQRKRFKQAELFSKQDDNREEYNQLSDEANYIIRLVLKTRMGLRTKEPQAVVIDWLRKKHWSDKKIREVFAEIREVLE
jgi:hypothetical protein